MNIMNKSIALATCALLAATVSACVEQEPSMSLEGSVLYEGTLEDGVPVCETTADPESVEHFSSRGQLDIWELENWGQFGPDGGNSSFVFNAAILNLLEESTQVGAGGGGGGDNFQGLKADQNSIMITGATVRFPGELNKFDGSEFASNLEKKELFTAVLDSNGGGALVGFPIFGTREISKLKAFYRDAIEASPNVAGGTEDAIIPLIAEIQIEGETFSGREVESNKFQYPIDICLDCTPEVNKDDDQMNDEVDNFQTTSTCFITG
jgi:hypothetical protein